MSADQNTRLPLRLMLAKPRGFCAGVDRAVQIVERALEKFGAPVYVRHEIVHNARVVGRLEQMGAIFVDELDAVPDGAQVIFSAHGVAKSVPQAADERGLNWLDATCPLVSKVHIEAARHFETGYHILLVGHAGHPEVIGTMGQVPDGHMTLIETEADVAAFIPPRDENGTMRPLAYVTQTTLSVDDTATIVAALQARFPDIAPPHKDDICYATTNRQTAVKQMATQADYILVIGAPNSSNSQRLVEVAMRAGCRRATLIGGAEDIDWESLLAAAQRDNIGATDAPALSIGLTAGASAPEEITREVISAFEARFAVQLEELSGIEEHVHFKLPRSLRESA